MGCLSRVAALRASRTTIWRVKKNPLRNLGAIWAEKGAGGEGHQGHPEQHWSREMCRASLFRKKNEASVSLLSVTTQFSETTGLIFTKPSGINKGHKGWNDFMFSTSHLSLSNFFSQKTEGLLNKFQFLTNKLNFLHNTSMISAAPKF